MRKCNRCNVSFDGTRENCPLCQGALTGEASEWNWEPSAHLKTQAFVYKLQWVVVLSICAVALVLDFLLDLNPGAHYSFVALLWSLSLEILIRDFIKTRAYPTKIISLSSVAISILLSATAWYYGFFEPIFYITVPCIIGACIVSNFVFCFIDKHGNTLVYLLSTIVIGAIPYVVVYFMESPIKLPWTICLIISIVALIGIIGFKGKQVKDEFLKRFNF